MFLASLAALALPVPLSVVFTLLRAYPDAFAHPLIPAKGSILFFWHI